MSKDNNKFINKAEDSLEKTIVDQRKRREKAYKDFEFFSTQLSYLEGKILTVVDASYSDREQRDAVKSLVRKEIRSWGDWVHGLIIHTIAPSEEGNEQYLTPDTCK